MGCGCGGGQQELKVTYSDGEVKKFANEAEMLMSHARTGERRGYSQVSVPKS